MKKKIATLLFVITIFVLGIFLYHHFNGVDIDRVLESSSYSYLPVEAKNYIQKAYEDTGDVILTEKNKKENYPYLNPDYVEYLTLSESEKESVAVIPDIYRLDYFVTKDNSGDSYPSSYDLRSVSGKNFITPLKNQETLDLCWAFTTVEQAESLLLKNSNTSYSSSSTVLSPRQLDYATSYNGIYNYSNDLGYRGLTNGGNYFMAAMAMSNGVGLAKESTLPFSTVSDEKKLVEVMNYNSNIYELNNSISVPYLTSNATTTQINNYVNTVKSYVMNYGGAFVSTQSPGASCGSVNTDGSIILRVDGNCVQNSNHAMQIIGWDDNYSYSYCVSGSKHTSASSCSSGSRISGTGAWLIRNSWGDDSDYSYIHLAYDSINAAVDVTTDMTSMSSRNWDNNYHKELDSSYILLSTISSQYFEKKIDTPEKIQKVKFYSYGEGGQFTISINSENANYSSVKTFTVDHEGLYTIDLSDKNIVINDSGFNVQIKSNNGVAFFRDVFEVFTSNVDTSTPIIKTKDYANTNSGMNYIFTLYSKTKNIPSNGVVTYTLKDQNGTNYTSSMTVTNNKVAHNDINADIIISNSVPSGKYTLTTTYGSKSYTSNITLGSSIGLSGSGTTSSPYIINSEADLKKMALQLNAHYKLGSDITLTSEWEPVGTRENPFTGSFNGDGHKISNLTISNEHEYNGLFGYVTINGANTSNFKKVTFENINIDAKGDAGALIGRLTGTTSTSSSTSCSSTIEDVFVTSGHVYSYFGNGGAIVGSIYAPLNDNLGKHTYTFNRLFNAANVGGELSSGMVAFIYGGSSSSTSPTIRMTNIENLGVMNYYNIRTTGATFLTGTHGSIIGYGVNYSTVSLTNYFSGAYFIYGSYDDDGVIGYLSSGTSFTKSSGFSVLDDDMSITTLRSSSSYSSWSSFSSNWTIQSVNGLSRYPVIKGVNFTYTNIPDITLDVGDVVKISDYMTPKIDAAHKMYAEDPTNTSVISKSNISDPVTRYITDIQITALEPGTSKLHLYSNYDGYEKDINITVRDPNTTSITFYKNDGSDTSLTQTATYGASVTLLENLFERYGYTFSKWNTKADGTGTTYTNEQTFTLNTRDLVLYAQWVGNPYTIKYNANGGSGDMSDTTAAYGTPVNLRENSFTREDYVFTGWNTKADGTGTSYSDKQSVSNLTATANTVINLYAQWKRNATNSYVITGYQVDDDNNIIDGVSLSTSLSIYMSHIDYGDDYSVDVELNGKSYIFTGCKTKILKNNNLVVEYTNIVRGDISGDGIVNSADLLQMRQHLIGSKTLSGVYYSAGDVDKGGSINSGDLLRIRQHLLGTKPIT